MAYSLRLESGFPETPFLSDWIDLKASGIFSDSGSVSFEYALEGLNYDFVKDQTEISVWDESGEIPDTRFVIEGSNGSRAESGGVNTRSFSGRTLHKMFSEALVYTDGYPNSNGDGIRSFTNQTPGGVLSPLIAKAASLGELSNITWDFSTDADSAGATWRFRLGTYAVEQGVNLLQVIQNLVDQGLIEIRLDGRNLQAFNPGGSGADHSDDGEQSVVFWSSQNTLETPEQTDSRGLRTTALIRGDDNTWKEVSDYTSSYTYGRRTLFISQSGIKDFGTLQVVAQANLDRVKQVRSEKTYKYRPGNGSPVPFRDYRLGDWVLWEGAKGLERVRVRQLTIEASDATDAGTATATLNDMFLELEVALARKIDGITGGANAGGGGNVSPNPGETDTLAPAAPIGLSGTSEAYSLNDGSVLAQVICSWAQVTSNSDGSQLRDFGHYVVQWRYQTETSFDRPIMFVDAPSISFDGLAVRRNIDIRVAAEDNNGNRSPWSETLSLLTAFDAVPPPKPSTPKLAKYLGGIQYTWDGRDYGGALMPPDFIRLDVHASAVADFEPNANTRIDSMMVSGSGVTTEGVYGEPLYVRYVAYDRNDNESDPSDTASFIAQPLVALDIGQGAITSAKLAAAAVTRAAIAADAVTGTQIADDSISSVHIIARSLTAYDLQTDTITAASGVIGDLAILNANIENAGITNAKIANLAVNSAKITDLEVGKLTTGTMYASVIVAGAIRTSAIGARVELNSGGLSIFSSVKRTGYWDASSGDIEMTGTFRTESNAGRAIVIAPSLSGAVGLAANQSGIVFSNTSAGFRYAQVYDSGRALRLDSPAFDNSTRKGTTVGVEDTGFFVYTQGGSVGNGLSSLEVRNDGQWIMGASRDRAGRAYGTTSQWVIETVNGGAQAFGNSLGQWSLGTMASGGTTVTGDTDSWRYGTANTSSYISGTNSGTTFIGDSRSGGGRLSLFTGGFTLGAVNGAGMYTTTTSELYIKGGPGTNGLHVYLETGTFFRVDGGRGMYVNGDLAAYNKQFRIAHPDDPKRLLVHGTTESPEPGVHYWGEAAVGEDGTASVSLPTYFEGLTLKERRSALVTPLDSPVPLSAGAVVNGAFTVRGEAGTRFSWLVQAVRSDTSFDPEPLRPAGDDGTWFDGSDLEAPETIEVEPKISEPQIPEGIIGEEPTAN